MNDSFQQLGMGLDDGTNLGLEEEEREFVDGEIHESAGRMSHERSKALPHYAMPCWPVRSVKFLQPIPPKQFLMNLGLLFGCKENDTACGLFSISLKTKKK